MRLDFALLADAATVDGAGKLNVLGVFDRIRAREFPARHGRIALVLRLSAGETDAGQHRAEIRLRDPEDQDLVRLDGNLQVGAGPPGQDTHIPHVLNLDGLTFPQPGSYRFEIRVDDAIVATLPLILEEASGVGVDHGATGGPQGSANPPIFFAPGGPAEA